jgi:ribonuclease H / adenosylcobalamin/alpha-ribazole phosphatase
MSRDLIVEADGGSRGNPGPAAFGSLVRDAVTGQVLVELAESVGIATNNVAEYGGAIAGLQAAVEIDPDACVEVRLDSKLVVEQMSGRWQIKHPAMRDLAKVARAVIPAGQVTYTWVPRDQNGAADALVNEALDQFDGTTPVRIKRQFTTELNVLASQDLLGSVQELQARDIAEEALRTRPNVMVGWADLGTPVTTLMARHGASIYSLEKRFSGSGGVDVPLAPIGIEQAQALAQEVKIRGNVTHIVSSPILRTLQTAHIVAEATGLSVSENADFAECSFGDWDGLTFADVRERWPRELEEWLADSNVAPPGGESLSQCRDRVNRGREAVINQFPAQTILVVSHVLPIKLMTGIATGAPLESTFRMELLPCSLTSLVWFPDGNSSMFSFGEASHLREHRTDGV